MTGFKSGASDDDPLGGESEETSEAESAVMAGGSDTETGESITETASASSGLPWIYARNGITDGRARTVQLHLQQSTLRREQDALRDVDIDESVNKADLREAAYLVGLSQLDDVAAQLRDWGYDAQ